MSFKNYYKIYLTTLILTVLIISACSGPSSEGEENIEISLGGTIWLWEQTELDGGENLGPNNLGDYIVQFLAEEMVAAKADCNVVVGSYSENQSSLTINVSATTLVACPDDSLGEQFVADLGAAESYSIEDGELVINLADDSGAMRFTPQSTELAGTSWIVSRYNNGTGGVVNVKPETAITANFDEVGTVSGSASCNQYTGFYEVDDNNLTIGSIVATQKACIQPDGIMEQEQLFLSALRTASSYRFVGNVLEFRTADDALAVSLESASASVSGNVTYLQRIALPDDAVLTVQIRDTSLADAPAQVIGEQIIPLEGRQVPVDYEVHFNVADIIENHSYSMAARIEDDQGNLLFINDTNIPVITRGNPTYNVEIMVVQVGN